MKKTVIKLPGAGMIKAGPSRSPIPWLSYRDHLIDPKFYFDFFDLIKKNQDQRKYVLISGGVGSHLQMNLASDLGLSAEARKVNGIESIKSLQNLLLLYASQVNCSIHPAQIPFYRLQETIDKSHHGVFFVEPDLSFQSTDALAASASELISADLLVLFKTRTPIFYAGFEKETKITKWPIDDFIYRARAFEETNKGNYILDLKSLLTIKKSCIRSILLSPENIRFLFNIDNPEEITEIEL